MFSQAKPCLSSRASYRGGTHQEWQDGLQIEAAVEPIFMDKISVIGLDFAKNVFQVHGVDCDGEVVVRKQLTRSQLRRFFAKLAPCLIDMEACGGSHYWSRELTQQEHNVRMMALVFVKAYLKSNKNNRNDAEAICEAVQRPSMRFVQPKTPEQQPVLHLHHGRRVLVRQRIALSNHMRGVLSDYGIVLPQGAKAILQRLPELLDDADNDQPMLARHLLAEVKAEHNQLIERIERIEARIKGWHANNNVSQRLASIPGIGVLTTSALAATVGEGQDFRNGRQLAPTWVWCPVRSLRAGNSGY